MTISPYVVAGLRDLPGYEKINNKGFVKKETLLNFKELKEFIKWNFPDALQVNRKRETIILRYSVISSVYELKYIYSNISLTKVGALFPTGNDHSTVIWANKNIKNWLKYKEQFAEEMKVYTDVRVKIHKYIKEQI